ncbi:MAG: transposase, partial [Proteobacteria bacterium]
MAGRYVEYRKYPLDLKYEFLKSGRLEGLEKFEIPRTTAAYWIAKRKSIIREALLDSEHLQRIADLEQEVLKERALRIMVEQVRKIFPYAFSERIVKSKDDRVHLVAAIQKAAALTSLKRCLEVLGLTPRVYYRWTTATKPCLITLAECGRRHPQQLTAKEVETMRVYLCSKEYAHIPVQSLCKLAQRKGDLFCSVDTWYKYKKMYDWQRPHRKWKAKRKERGVRATESNQIWHVDVTHIKLASGKTMYLQAVIDNFSRYIVAWKLSEKISSLKTVDLLKQARRNLQNRGDRIPCQIMTDGGP